MLVVVRGDSVRQRVKRQGRFAIPKDLAASEQHMEDAVKEHLNLMVWGLAKRGFDYQGGIVEVRGPYPHVKFSDDATPDHGPAQRPDPRDEEAMAAFERAERARAARKVGHAEMEDYILVTTFERPVAAPLRVVPSSLHM